MIMDPEIQRRPMVRLARFVVQSRVSIALVLLALTALAATLLPRFQFEPDVSRLLPDQHPTVRLGRAVERHARISREMLIDLRGEALETKIESLVASLRTSPFLDQVSATRDEFLGENAERFREAPLYFLPPEVLDQLAERMTGEGRQKAIEDSMDRLATDGLAGKEVVLKDPLGLRWTLEKGVTRSLPIPLMPGTPYVIREDGQRAAIRARGIRVPYDLDYSRDLLADLHGRMKEAGVEGVIFGDYAQSQADARRIREDLGNSSIASIILVGLFLILSMRTLIDPCLVFVPVLLAIFWTLPIGGAILGPMTALTISAAAILIGLGVDFTIHFIVRYGAERQREGHVDAAVNTLRAIGRPLMASMLTTVAAFLSLSIAQFNGLRVFGLLLAFGLALAFLSTVLALPFFLGFAPKVRRVLPDAWIARGLEKAASHRFGGVITAGVLLLSVVGYSIFAARGGVPFASDLRFFRPEDDVLIAAKTSLENELGFSMMPVQLLFGRDVPLEAISRTLAALEDEGKVGLSLGPHNAHPSAARREQVSRFRERTAGWFDGTLKDLDAAGFHPDPFREGLEEFRNLFATDLPEVARSPGITVDGVNYQLVLAYPRQHIDSMKRWNAFQDAVVSVTTPEVRPRLFHVQQLLHEIHKVLQADLIRAAGLTAVVATLLVVLLSGGFRAGVLALLPTICGFGITLGVLAAFDIRLNMGNCVAIPFLLGIGVDHGIHLVAHFRRSGRGLPGSCGVAIWRSSATTILAFGSLATAQTPGIATMGLISVVGVVACLLTTLVVLPVLWRTWYGVMPPDDDVPAEDPAPVEAPPKRARVS